MLVKEDKSHGWHIQSYRVNTCFAKTCLHENQSSHRVPNPLLRTIIYSWEWATCHFSIGFSITSAPSHWACSSQYMSLWGTKRRWSIAWIMDVLLFQSEYFLYISGVCHMTKDIWTSLLIKNIFTSTAGQRLLLLSLWPNFFSRKKYSNLNYSFMYWVNISFFPSLTLYWFFVDFMSCISIPLFSLSVPIHLRPL